MPWRANQQADACNLTLFSEEKQTLSQEIKTLLDDISMKPGKQCRPWRELATCMLYNRWQTTPNQHQHVRSQNTRPVTRTARTQGR